jgi:hypothetical protein
VTTPSVSVVMAVHDGERFLRDAVESVLSQTLDDFELVVVDDGSTDATGSILMEYARADSRVVAIRQQNRGLSRSLNRAVTSARSPLIARLDADDVALPDRLERQLGFLARNDSVALVGGAVAFTNERGDVFAEQQYPTSDADIRRAFERTTPFVHSAVTMRRAAFDRAGGYRPVFVEAEDLDLWLRIADSHPLANLPVPVVRYRIHAGQATVRRLEIQALCSVAARAAWRTRGTGAGDSLDGVSHIDRVTLHALGVTDAEIADELVRNGVWLAKTLSRAGGVESGEALFDLSLRHARSSSGSRSLVAYVHRERARRLAERGRTLRSRVSLLKGALAAGSRGRRSPDR